MRSRDAPGVDMCTEHEHGHDRAPRVGPDVQTGRFSGLTRRGFLRGSGLVAAAGIARAGAPALDRLVFPRAWASTPSLQQTPDGRSIARTAMHLHSSFSEGQGSIGGHLAELDRLGFDAAFFTDHDWRQRAVDALPRAACNNLNGESNPGSELGWKWSWERQADLGNHNAKFVPERDAVWLRIVNDRPELLSTLASGDTKHRGKANRQNLTGVGLVADFDPGTMHNDGFMELTIEMSYHRRTSTRAGGHQLLTYRWGRLPHLRRTGSAYHLENAGHRIVVERNIHAMGRQQHAVEPVEDMKAAFVALGIDPFLVAEDNSLHDLHVGVASRNGAIAAGFWHGIDITSTLHTGSDPEGVMRDILAQYAGDHDLLVDLGQELSLVTHVNQFPSASSEIYLHPSAYTRPKAEATLEELYEILAGARGLGGLTTYNHPFGAQEGELQQGSDRAADLELTLTRFATAGRKENDVIERVDGLEVFYRRRGNVGMLEHLRLWEGLTANGYVLFANGVSDDHLPRSGQVHKQNNPMATMLVTEDLSHAGLNAAIASGRMFAAHMTKFAGSVDLQVGEHFTGAVIVDPAMASTSTLLVHGAGLRSDGSFQVIQVPVVTDNDQSSPIVGVFGHPVPVNGSTVVSNSALASGPLAVTFDTSISTAVYVRFLDPQGDLLGGTNMIYLLRVATNKPINSGRDVANPSGLVLNLR